MKFSRMFFAALLLTALFGGKTLAANAENLTQTVNGGGVTAKVTYLNPKSADDPRFLVVLDTHSVNLDTYDLKTVAVLRDGGKSYAPTAAENKAGGHHREVTLTFAKLTQDSKRVELVIKDIAGVKERTYVWNSE
jgi:hypothetical protein